MKLRLIPIPLRLVLAVSVPTLALLAVVGLQVAERSETARVAAEELTRTEALRTLAQVQTANALPDLAALRMRVLANDEVSSLAEVMIAELWERYSADFMLADEARTQLDLAATGLDIEGGTEAFDSQRQTADALLDALAGRRELSDELVSEAQAARVEADLTFARMANRSSSNALITYAAGIDASRSATVEYSYVITTLLGLDPGSAQQLTIEIDDITGEAINPVRSELANVERNAVQERRTMLWVTGLVLAITAGLTGLVLRSVLAPLGRIGRRVNDLADGAIDEPRIDHGQQDALSELGNKIEDVADGLRHLGQQFEAMAEGDLDDPSFEFAAPGLLGTFVQDWVQEVRQSSGNPKAEATHDQLTGLLNRQGLADHLGRMAGGPEIAVVYLDLDKFKAVNDVHGHRHGDAVLKVVARRLLGYVREEDPVCRLDGDEFVLLVTGVERRDMPIFTSRLELGISEPISFEGTVHNVGCSIGVGWLGPGDLLEPILKEADKRMLDAKAANPDRIPR